MFSTFRRAPLSRCVLAVAILVCLLGVPALTCAQDTSLFRIFLLEGPPLVSYGEFARVGDRVVFSVPLDSKSDAPVLQMVSIPAATVDWARTEEYAHAVRAKRYADTRGEEDFTLLASRVTQALNDINLTPDPKRRVAMAEEARRNLAAWPAANYGYRAGDVMQLVTLLDEVIGEMRVAAGQRSFDLSFVATTRGPTEPTIVLLPTPDDFAEMESAYRAASVADPAERIAVLRALSDRLPARPGPRDERTEALRARVRSMLDAELRIERAYIDLARSSLRDADQRASRGDVRGLQQIIARALSADDRLGRSRSGEMSALLAALDLRMNDAHRVRLAMEATAKRVEVFKVYARASREPRERLDELMRHAREIRDRKGPGPRALHQMEIGATIAIHQFRVIDVPPELQGAHGLFITALQLTQQAATLRRDALSSKNTKLAWDASSAAAGAVMLAERAAEELRALIESR
jgi:hypothetical protein